MARPELAEAPRPRRRRAALAGIESRLVRAVARAPANVRTKLLVAFLGIAALLILIVVLGLRVLGQSNARVERLGRLQQRASTYQTLLTQANELRQLLALRAGGASGFATLTGRKSTVPAGRSWSRVDKAIVFALSELSPSTNEATYRFVPSTSDERVLERIRSDFNAFARSLDAVLALDSTGASGEQTRPSLQRAIDADQDLFTHANALAARTDAQTSELIAANRSAYSSSQELFTVFGAGSVALALGLGLILSWSLIGPIQRTEARLAEIAAGDFSGNLDIPNRDELGALAANVNQMNDELRRLYGELETASRHKSAFLASMSHELRTPLTAIIGFSEVLHDGLAESTVETQREYLVDIIRSSRHLLDLINDVLDLSKVEAGHLALDLSRFSLREVLESGLHTVREAAHARGVTLTLDVASEVEVIEGDARLIRQVVFNLLANAVKFTPSNGRVDVSAIPSGRDDVCVAVRDSGIGIAPTDLERIFQEFQQTDGTAGGTGLGLALARRFVELHGGRITVVSELGIGSTFSFTVPCSGAKADGSSGSADHAAQSPSRAAQAER
jgi:signal transduction histidine kinase